MNGQAATSLYIELSVSLLKHGATCSSRGTADVFGNLVRCGRGLDKRSFSASVCTNLRLRSTKIEQVKL